MKRLAAVALSAGLMTGGAAGQDLSGDVRLACEAILCLSSGVRPGECAPALARYFGISFKRWTDTVRGRINFLNLCPVSGAPDMPALVEAIGNGAGLCSADQLNLSLAYEIEVKDCGPYGYTGSVETSDECPTRRITVVGNQAPSYCQAYTAHKYTYGLGLKYVGDPMDGGRWVEGTR